MKDIITNANYIRQPNVTVKNYMKEKDKQLNQNMSTKTSRALKNAIDINRAMKSQSLRIIKYSYG